MSPTPSSIPPQTGRWFFGYEAAGLDSTSPFVISRLLEEGDGPDLRWLTAQADETTLRTAVTNPRSELSRRSRAFWQLVLDATPVSPGATASNVWPLDH